MQTKFFQFMVMLVLSVIIAACASSSSSKQPQVSSAQPVEQQIVGNIPAGSPFAKLKIGMSQKQAHDLIGQPTDTKNYTTGKMFIPFYFGKDTMRMEELYKGQGRITYTGAGIGGVNYHIHQITYDPNEDGYNNN